MTKNGQQVLAGFAVLNDADKKEVIDEILHYRNADPSTQRAIGYDFETKGRGRIFAGPLTPVICACCGR
jgi:hypothetical protein